MPIYLYRRRKSETSSRMVYGEIKALLYMGKYNKVLSADYNVQSAAKNSYIFNISSTNNKGDDIMIQPVMRMEWVPIPSLEDNIKPYYYISNTGLVYSTYYNKFIIPHENHAGYLQVSLMTETGRVFRKVHRLVIMCFNPINNPELYEVNHIDGIKYHNWIWNLEWVTSKENKHHAIINNLSDGLIGESNPHNKITEKTARLIGDLLISRKYSDDEIISITKCPNKEIIRNIANGNTWRYLFNDNELEIMKLTRAGSRLLDSEVHNICKYYEDNKYKYNGYGSVIAIAKDTLYSNNLPLTDQLIRLAKRIYYRYEYPEICNLYNY